MANLAFRVEDRNAIFVFVVQVMVAFQHFQLYCLSLLTLNIVLFCSMSSLLSFFLLQHKKYRSLIFFLAIVI